MEGPTTSQTISVILCYFIILATVEALQGNTNHNPASDYCRICIDHTMCLHPGSEPGISCGRGHQSSPFIQVEIEALVEAHNTDRDTVARGFASFSSHVPPAATNMRTMRWNQELAEIAQRWADQCMGGKKDFCRDVEGFKVGQNVVALTTENGISPQSDFLSSVRSWYREGERFEVGNVDRFNRTLVEDSNAASYSQLVWADSDAVGCGRAMIRGAGTEIVVCNYAPAGNIDGGRVYKTGGDPAGDCPRGTRPDADYVGLCYNTAWEKVKNNAIAAYNYELIMKTALQNLSNSMHHSINYWKLLLILMLLL